jgi:hypothetical protein
MISLETVKRKTEWNNCSFSAGKGLPLKEVEVIEGWE